MSSKNEINDDSMLYVSFNQDNSFFSIGTERGFRIYQTYPFSDPYERIMNGGIGVVEMLYKSNFLALMGGGRVPKYGKNKLVIWDDYENKVISELKFTTTIMTVKLKKDLLFVVCQKRIYVFDFNTFESKDIIDTGDNKNELIAINGAPDYTVIAYPSQKIANKISIKNYKSRKIFAFGPQDDSVSKMSINNTGTLIATSNETGTIIRIHSCNDGAFLQEFRRGIEKAKINYICFDNDSKLMAVSSSRGTIHIFSMGSSIKKLKEHEKKKELIKNKDVEKKKDDEKEKKIEDEKIKKEENKEEQKEKGNEKTKEDTKEEEKKEEKKIEKNENIENNNIIIDKDDNKNNIIVNNEEINKIEEKNKEEEIKNEIKENNINENNIIENKENNKDEEIKNEEELPENTKTFLGGFFGSQTEKSFAQVRIKSTDSICAFAKNNILVIISSDNKYYQAAIDIKKGGNCKIIQTENLIKKPINSSQFEII